MTTDPSRVPELVYRDEPCPADHQPYVAFSIGHLVAEIRRYQVRIWRSPNRELAISEFRDVRDSLDTALLLLSEHLHGGVLVIFFRELQKVLDDVDWISGTVASPALKHYKMRRRIPVPGKSNWKRLVALVKRVFAKERLARWGLLGVELSTLIRQKNASDHDLTICVASAHRVANAAYQALPNQALERLLCVLELDPLRPSETGLDPRLLVIGSVRNWSAAMVEKLHFREDNWPILSIDFDLEQVVVHGIAIPFADFQRMHLRCLHALAKHPNQPIRRERLKAFMGTDRSLEDLTYYVTRLRKILWPPIQSYFKHNRRTITMPSHARKAYIISQQKKRVMQQPSSYYIAILPELVEIAGNAPEALDSSVDLLGTDDGSLSRPNDPASG